MTELSSGTLRLCSSSATARGDLWGYHVHEHHLSLDACRSDTLHPVILDRRYTSRSLSTVFANTPHAF